MDDLLPPPPPPGDDILPPPPPPEEDVPPPPPAWSDYVPRQNLDLRKLPSRQVMWIRRFVGLSGLAGAVIGVVLGIQYMQTPAILLEDPITAYAATHTATGSLPATRTGLWVEIPQLSIALPIKEGDGSDNIPDWYAMHYPCTAQPGQVGNSYLYAHGLRGMFGNLLRAQNGQQVILHDYTANRIAVFHITRVVGNVAWNDASWIWSASNVPQLTLQTCIGALSNTDRWIVLAS